MPAKERLDRHEERLDRHDRQIAAIRNLIQDGMRLVIEDRKHIRALMTAQKKTDAMLQDLIRSLKAGGNGHRKGNLNL